MTQDTGLAPTSLERLHDIVLPPDVPAWPPAPGLQALLAAALLILAWLARRAWVRRRADAYRRAALGELADLEDAPAIAELLRRTALAVAPRAVVAGLRGEAWADWLAERSPVAMPEAVRAGLTAGVYGRPGAEIELGALRAFAAAWITRHRQPSGS